MELKINPEFQKLIPRPTQEQYDVLKLSIMTEGLLNNLEALEDGTIIDGHTRFLICNELNKTIPESQITVKKFSSEFDVKAYMIEVNLKRRHLNDFQRVQLECLKLEMYREKAKEKQGERTDLTSLSNDKQVESFQVDKIISQQSGVSTATVNRVLKIRKKASESLLKELEKGKTTISSAYAKIQEIERQENRNQVLSETSFKLPEEITLFQGDFSQVDIADNSIQLILTDPPYPEEFLECWTKLAEFAKNKLVPGGFLVAYSGQLHLPQVFERLCKNLDYFWTMALITPTQNTAIHPRHVFCEWKPILIFNKPPLTAPPYFGDTITASPRNKSLHGWQQGQAPFERLIEQFCPSNGVVLDPMAGTGTTLLAAKKLGRKSIGIEVNPETFITMQKRLTDES